MSQAWLVIPAAGIGSRFKSETPKQYITIAGKTVLQWAITRLVSMQEVKGVVIALREDDPYWPNISLNVDKPVHTVVGGKERSDSVRHCLEFLSQQGEQESWVLVHDAARPCIKPEHVERLLATRSTSQGGILGVPVRDTLKRVDAEGIEVTVDRSQLWQAQTPQMFKCGDLLKALLAAEAQGAQVTDEASAMELSGVKPLMVEGCASNLKITYHEDLILAKSLLENQ